MCKHNICSVGLLLLGSCQHEAQHCSLDPTPHSLGALQQRWLLCNKGQGFMCLPPAGSELLHQSLK